MRITNHMIYGNSMTNIHRNARHLNNLVTQIETGARFQRPSEDPISASRVLRYRTILAETQQFFRNVESGLAWMEVSEAAFMNLTQDLLQHLNVRIIEGATGTLTLADRLAIIEEMKQYIDQIGTEMNQTFLGRYVFSGFRTDQPPVFMTDNNYSFVITQEFNRMDFERIQSFQKEINDHPDPNRDSAVETAVVRNANVLKLAFAGGSFDFEVRDADGNAITTPGATPGIVCPNGGNFEVRLRSITDYNAYAPPSELTDDGAFVVHFIQETGEMVFSDAARDAFQNGTRITYHREDFSRGDLNPLVYFESIEITARNGNYLTAGGETNALVDEEIKYEIAPNSLWRINDKARHVFTDKMFADFRRFVEFAESIVISDPRALEAHFRAYPHNLTGDALSKAVEDQIATETSQANSVLHDRFNNMLQLMERHFGTVAAVHTQMGARMSRFDMGHIRLAEDEVHYADLLSDAGGYCITRLSEAIMRKNAAEAVFNIALRTVAITTQLTLADFINR